MISRLTSSTGQPWSEFRKAVCSAAARSDRGLAGLEPPALYCVHWLFVGVGRELKVTPIEAPSLKITARSRWSKCWPELGDSFCPL
jgi:hypothetical protein